MEGIIPPVCIVSKKQREKCYNCLMRRKKIFRLRRDKANYERRVARREDAPGSVECQMFKDKPTPEELKSALREDSDSHLGVIRMAALMNNLSMHYPSRVRSDDADSRKGRAGILQYLAEDGYLASRYDTLMRYKRLGDAIREIADIELETNLLWGLPDYAPKDEDEAMFIEFHCEDVQKLKNLYASCEGMNFKQIKERMK